MYTEFMLFVTLTAYHDHLYSNKTFNCKIMKPVHLINIRLAYR